MVRIPTFLLSLPDSHKMRNFMKNELHYDVQFLILHFKVFGDTLLAWLNFCSFKSQKNYPSKSIFFFSLLLWSISPRLVHPDI